MRKSGPFRRFWFLLNWLYVYKPIVSIYPDVLKDPILKLVNKKI